LPGKATIQPSDEKQVSTKPPPLAEVSEIACLCFTEAFSMSRLEGSPLAIAADALRYGIEFGIPGVKPFVIQNLGKYERQAWQEAEFPSNGQNHLEEQRERESAYR
jgi:hypothetical protein